MELIKIYSIDELKDELREIVNESLKNFKTISEPQKTKFLTRKQTAQKLSLSLVTLNRRTNEGILKSYNIGGRILYKEDEIEKALFENNKEYRRF